MIHLDSGKKSSENQMFAFDLDRLTSMGFGLERRPSALERADATHRSIRCPHPHLEPSSRSCSLPSPTKKPKSANSSACYGIAVFEASAMPV